MKLFTAISLPVEIVSALSQIKDRNKHLKAIRWTKPEKFHITTYYLGETNPGEVEKIYNSLEKVCSEHKSHQLNFKKLDFSPRKNPYMIWVYYELNESFRALCNDIVDSLQSEMPARSKPTPHVTIARFKKQKHFYQPNLTIDIKDPIPVNEVELWQTENGVYTLLKKFPLQ